MFQSENIPALFKTATLKQDDEGHRFAAATFVIEPFFYPLALELGHEVYGHLFDPDETVRPEVTEIAFQPKPGTAMQHLIVRAAPDAPGTAKITPLRIEGYKVAKTDPDKPRLRLTISTSFSLAEKLHRAFAIDRFGTSVYLTFHAINGQLPMDAGEQFVRDTFAIPGITSVSMGVRDAKGNFKRSVTITREDAAKIGRAAKAVLTERRKARKKR